MTLSTKFFIGQLERWKSAGSLEPLGVWWETKSPFRENEEGAKNGKPIKTV